MLVTKQDLINLIHDIGQKIDQLNGKIIQQEEQIRGLESQNEDLSSSNQATLDKIKEYIQELKQIRSHYVDSKNNSE